METDLARKLDDLDQRLQRLETTLGAFARLADRIDRIEAMVDALGTFAERLPTLTDAAGAGVAFAMREADARGIDPVTSGLKATELGVELLRPQNLELAGRMLSPENVATLDRLATSENLRLLERLASRRPLVEKLLAATEGVDESALVEVVQKGAGHSGTLAKVLGSPTTARLLNAAAGDKVLDTAEHATTALIEARATRPEQVGLFGTLGKLGDPDVKRAVGFGLAVAKRFGQLLDR
jgi:uncharacterized protein YjgD (DUF1641 family)